MLYKSVFGIRRRLPPQTEYIRPLLISPFCHCFNILFAAKHTMELEQRESNLVVCLLVFYVCLTVGLFVRSVSRAADVRTSVWQCCSRQFEPCLVFFIIFICFYTPVSGFVWHFARFTKTYCTCFSLLYNLLCAGTIFMYIRCDKMSPIVQT